MNSIIESLTGMNVLTDQVIATDFLISAKSGVRNFAFALTEATTPRVREVLHKRLNEAIELHAEITNLMIDRGWYHPNNASEQIAHDMQTGQTAVDLTYRGPYL